MLFGALEKTIWTSYSSELVNLTWRQIKNNKNTVLDNPNWLNAPIITIHNIIPFTWRSNRQKPLQVRHDQEYVSCCCELPSIWRKHLVYFLQRHVYLNPEIQKHHSVAPVWSDYQCSLYIFSGSCLYINIIISEPNKATDVDNMK